MLHPPKTDSWKDLAITVQTALLLTCFQTLLRKYVHETLFSHCIQIMLGIPNLLLHRLFL